MRRLHQIAGKNPRCGFWPQSLRQLLCCGRVEPRSNAPLDVQLLDLEIQVIVQGTAFVEIRITPSTATRKHVIVNRQFGVASPAQNRCRLTLVDTPLTGFVGFGLRVAEMAWVIPIAALETNRDDVFWLVIVHATRHTVYGPTINHGVYRTIGTISRGIHRLKPTPRGERDNS